MLKEQIKEELLKKLEALYTAIDNNAADKLLTILRKDIHNLVDFYEVSLATANRQHNSDRVGGIKEWKVEFELSPQMIAHYDAKTIEAIKRDKIIGLILNSELMDAIMKSLKSQDTFHGARYSTTFYAGIPTKTQPVRTPEIHQSPKLNLTWQRKTIGGMLFFFTTHKGVECRIAEFGNREYTAAVYLETGKEINLRHHASFAQAEKAIEYYFAWTHNK